MYIITSFHHVDFGTSLSNIGDILQPDVNKYLFEKEIRKICREGFMGFFGWEREDYRIILMELLNIQGSVTAPGMKDTRCFLILNITSHGTRDDP